MKAKYGITLAMSVMAIVVTSVRADWAQGFEADSSNWYNVNRVTSGTAGVTSAEGAYHATFSGASPARYTDFGGYNYGAGNAVPTAFTPYTTNVAIYLDVETAAASDTRFDFTSAISNNLGAHRRDFAFNVGFYADSDMTGPGAGLDRYIVSASNTTGRANAYPKNPGRAPIAIATTGWYRFEHEFYANGGVLAVDLSIYSDTNTLVGSWTLSDPTDTLANIGGNRYGWFAANEFSSLAVDATSMDVQEIPEPASLSVLGLGAAALLMRRRRNA